MKPKPAPLKNRLKTFVLVILVLTAAQFTFAQGNSSRAITVHQYRQVDPDKIAEFIKRETTYYSEVAKKAMEKGNLQFWALLQRVGGDAKSPNFLFINVYRDIDAIGEVWSSAAAVFPKVPMSQIETGSMSKVVGTYFLLSEAFVRSPKATDADFKYVKFNYLTSSNPQSSIALEKKHWQPFIQAAMENGQCKQVAWRTKRLLSPTGEDMKFNIVTVDVFPSLKEALYPTWDEKIVFPTEALTEMRKLEVRPRSSEIYSIVKSVSGNVVAN